MLVLLCLQTMDEHTSLVLALQLVALACIACALLLYLLRRIRPQPTGLQTKEVSIILSLNFINFTPL